MRSAGSALLTAWMLVTLVGCSADSIEEQLESQLRNPTGVLGAADPDESAHLSEWGERLSGAKVDLRIGTLDSLDAAFVFGKIVDLLSDQDENLLVLDAQANSLRIFSSTGHLLHSVGRSGRGPGELMMPISMEWLSPNELAVFDGGRRLQRFRYVTGERPDYLAEVSTNLAVEATCSTPSGLWIHGLDIDSQNLIHKFDPLEGGLEASLGPATDVGNPLLQLRHDLGHMDCFAEGTENFALTSRYFPRVRVFDRTGEERWHATIQDFHPMEFTPIQTDGRVGLRQGVSPEARGFHLIQSVVALDATAFLVQVGWVGESEAGSEYTSLESVLFSSRTGRSIPVTRELPLIHRATSEGFLASESDPFPQVLRYRFVDQRTER